MASLLWCLLLAYVPFSLSGSLNLIGSTSSELPDLICAKIEHAISSASDVYYPGDPLYEKGIFHPASSSSQQSKCVVEAGTADDVGKILIILGQTQTPFAVKGGGHTTNPGFSSTTGVHISMYRFSEINYDPDSNTVDLGAGLIWDDVYAALDPLGAGVVGGRDTGVGIAGYLLGGGYSFKTNQFGLGVDNILAFELVLPNGQVTTVTKVSDPDLFFGLKGGQNNFGVVTKFTIKTHPQTQVWGGAIVYPAEAIPDVTAAAVAFQGTTDPKTAIVMGYLYDPTTQGPTISLNLFYDAPTPPPGLFDAFLSVPAISTDINTRNFLDLVLTTPTNETNGARTYYQGFPIISYSAELSDVLVNETVFWGKTLTEKSLSSLSYAAEIFLPSIYSHNSDKTAYPPIRNIPFSPYVVGFSWNSSQFDADFHDAAVQSASHVRQAAIAQGQTDVTKAPIYPNYAIFGTPLEDMYGNNVPLIRSLKDRVDPNNVMGLAGGWKF